jgi:pyruvate-formate lyase-activating enzyme
VWNKIGLAQAISDPILLPRGTQLVFLPGRRAIGIHPKTGRPELVSKTPWADHPYTQVVAAILPPGYLRLALPAYRSSAGACTLPLRAYTAVGIQGDRLVTLATRIDPRKHWDPERFQEKDLRRKVKHALRLFQNNQVLRQLARCVLEYSCCTASNIFLGTHEGALPLAPRCNAQCLGCISKQRKNLVASPQERLHAAPPVQDIVDVAVAHLSRAKPGMVSFGQGCEGEPLTEVARLRTAIQQIRKRTSRGSIHLNTNGSFPERIGPLIEAGLNSVRVSMLSARSRAFHLYHRGSFDLKKVESFVRLAVSGGLHVSINYLVFPGFTDRPGEIKALLAFLGRTGAHMLQLRNLDLDPVWLLKKIPPAAGQPIGMLRFVKELKKQIPTLDIGSFNRFREEYKKRLPVPFLDPSQRSLYSRNIRCQIHKGNRP